MLRMIKQNQEDEFKHSVPNLWTQICHTTLNLHVQYIRMSAKARLQSSYDNI